MGAVANPEAKTVYIILLNWNGIQDTLECLESCRALTYRSAQIVVVDNASSDGSEDLLRQRYPDLPVLQTGSNLGYAGGNNVGIRYALERGADYVWLLNNDTTVHPEALSELVRVAETEREAGILGSKILSYADPKLIWFAGGWVQADRGETGHVGLGVPDLGQFDAVTDTGYVTGCSLLVKREVIEKIGTMDEGYFLYFEESEWCLRAKRQGYRLLYTPGSVVWHKESVSTRKLAGAWIYYMTRNRLYFMSRNGSKARWFSRFAADLSEVLRLLAKGEFRLVNCMSAGYWHWLTGYRGRREHLVKG
ncbi:glycosyl transferase [Geomonas limicola]|uniref:Glycosyl transferase n=1 Tax=Geomonas limicola TaxID=2740186 RepID=A0A6V8N6K7_9BACT|nr:glycosyltransferase family 2 protein [Geomonas limicola]GFO68111.1 glycosyl transferase [Geomonas limicola]